MHIYKNKMLSVTEKFFFFSLLLQQTWQYTNGELTTFWWNVKPYFYTENGGNPKGIIVDILNKFNVYCSTNYKSVASQHINNGSFDNYSSFLKALQSYNFSFNKTVHDIGYILWMPVISRKVNITDKRFATRHLFQASGAFVIVKQDFISFENKLLSGICETMNILILVIVLAFCMGVVIWSLVSFGFYLTFWILL